MSSEPRVTAPIAPSRRFSSVWLAAVLGAVLWLASSAINWAFSWNGVLGGSIGAVFPATMPPYVWARSPLWLILAAVAGLLAVALLHRTVTRVFAAAPVAPRMLFVTLWFAAVVAGGVVGLALDLSTIIDAFPPMRLQMLLDGLGTGAATGAYWGLVQGWIPALLVARLSKKRGAAPEGVASRRAVVGVAVFAALSLVAVSAVGVAGIRAAQTQDVQQEATANGFDESEGALPDPYAEGDPVPTVAPDSVTPASDWCTPDTASLLLGSTDAATGHRVYSITLVNYSAEPCVVEGYPDVAMADQNGHALDVTIEHGGSFMATDPGPQRVEIPPQGSAITYLGWNAASPRGQLVASTLFAAQYDGQTRGSWPVKTDIVPGSTVKVTAWALKQADTSD
jgi:hypothetical protein